MTRPLQIGAALGGANPAAMAAMQQYGDAVGVAFQLRDDVLGVFGDPLVTGKEGSDDLRDGKASLLLVRAMRLAAPADRSLLAACLGDPDLDVEHADRCRDAVAASGALASIEHMINAQVEKAECALDALAELALVGAVIVHLIGKRHLTA